MAAIYAISAFFMTLAGGLFAFHYRRYLLYIMAFSSGLLIGVVFLDLLPEVVSIANEAAIEFRHLMLMVICGFLAIFLLEKLTIIHSEKLHDAPGHHHHVGIAGAIGMAFHSFLDGLAIGVGFKAGAQVGVVVLIAVLAHDFADGLNTVTFMLATKNTPWRTYTLLGIAAVAPVLGALTSSLLHIEPRMLAFQLSFSFGFLLYLGASDLLPQVHVEPRWTLILSTLAGVLSAGFVVFGLEHLHAH